jgi:hypothetical protein
MTISANDAIELSKSIIAEFHRCFTLGGADYCDHVMAIKRVITAACRHFPDESNEVEKSLLDYTLDFFEEEWLRLVKEGGEEYDSENKLEEARRVFLRIFEIKEVHNSRQNRVITCQAS